MAFCSVLQGGVNHYLERHDKRYASFEMARKLITERGLKTWVETGTARNGRKNCVGDGCSTLIYSDFLKSLPGELYSVDIDPEAIYSASQALKYAKEKVHFITADSIAFLKMFPAAIDFLYLDSYDYCRDNPYPSQKHHLKEIEAAYDKLHDNSVVMIDDCALPEGGKGILVIHYLLDRGWKIAFKGYQVILVKDV